MKTILQALTDEVHYPIEVGCIENKIIARGLDSSDYFTMEVAKSNSYRGALADCFISLITAPSFTEADKSISEISDKDKILEIANSIYRSIGEDEVLDEKPTVYIGC
jgi:hypothetical protein